MSSMYLLSLTNSPKPKVFNSQYIRKILAILTFEKLKFSYKALTLCVTNVLHCTMCHMCHKPKHLCLTSLILECHLVPATILMKGRGNSLKISCFSHTVKNTLKPLLSGQHAHQRRPQSQTSLGV